MILGTHTIWWVWLVTALTPIPSPRDSVGDKVDISELSWEQKEQVLRALFAKINQTPKPQRVPTAYHPLPPLPLPLPPPETNLEEATEGEEGAENTEKVFLTQQSGPHIDGLTSNTVTIATQVT